MRICVLLLLLVPSALLAQSESAVLAQLGSEQPIGNVIVVRGSKPRPAAPAPKEKAEKPAPEPEAAETAEAAQAAGTPEQPEEKKAEPEEEKLPRQVDSSAKTVLPGGQTLDNQISDSIRRTETVTEAIKTLENINGREVPYLTDREEVISKAAGHEVKERRVQRYDASGNPTQQELTKIEKRKLPDGTLVTTETMYQETINGRMEPIERKVTRETKSGNVTKTVSQTEAPSPNGGYQPVLREESVERKIGENRAEVETTRSARIGSGLAVVAREQSTMSKSGNTSTTETTVYERNPGTNKMTFSERKVGRLTERPDGSQTEKVETYGLKTASGATNINATRPVLQEVVNRSVSVSPDGEVRETTRVQQRANGNAGGLVPGPVTEAVVRPTDDGATRRTEVHERGVNGRSNATRVVVEKIQK